MDERPDVSWHFPPPPPGPLSAEFCNNLRPSAAKALLAAAEQLFDEHDDEQSLQLAALCDQLGRLLNQMGY